LEEGTNGRYRFYFFGKNSSSSSHPSQQLVHGEGSWRLLETEKNLFGAMEVVV